MVKIIIDAREKNSGIPKELVKHRLNFEIKQMEIADFVIEGADIEGKTKTVGIERKRQIDFINSIIDKRIVHQLISLKENFDIPLLIIEGSENIYSLRNFHPNAIRGMLASIAIDYRIPIIYTKNHRDTASLINVIAKRFEKPKKYLSSLKKRKPTTIKEQQELIIETLPGVGPLLAKSLLKKFGSVKKIMNAKEGELLKIEKLGPVKVKKIKNVIEEDYK